MTIRRLTPIALCALLTLVGCASPQVADDEPTTDEADAEPVHLRIIGANDFHGALEGPNGEVTVDGESVEAGGAAYLASHVDRLEEESEHTTFVVAGDLIGASPLVSSLFFDEPTIEAFNAIGLDISSVGNHEFDRGVDELMRIDEGGCHPDEGCREDHEYRGTDFDYLAANVTYRATGEPIMPPYTIRNYDEATVGYIGMTLEKTPEVVVPSAIEDVEFHNEVETVEKYLPELEEEGVDTVIVVVHEGGAPTGEPGDIGDCADVEGDIVTMAEEMPDEVSVIVSGHTHLPYICEFGGKLVTQAAHSGQVLTAIDLHIDPAGGVVDRSAEQHAVTPDIGADDDIAALIDEYATLAEPRAQRTVGTITDDLPRGPRRAAGESPIGRLIADAQLEATTDEADADVAFMNPGGIRDALDYDEETDGAVTYEQLHTIQPFANLLITMTLTGDEIHDLLEQQWREDARPHLLAVSSSFSYEWSADAEVGQRVDFDSIELHGQPLERDREYRVTVNNFLADGGDGFTILTEGRDRVGGAVDLDVLADYVERHSPIEPPEDVRAVEID